MKFLVLVSSLTVWLRVEGFLYLHPPNTTDDETPDISYRSGSGGRPLFLTPILEKGDFSRAQRLSKVTPDIFRGVPSYSAYFTVNKECGSNLFFWFFPAQQNWEEAPLVLWLQGGPGVSSLFGLFDELGPISVKSKRVQKRKFSWNMKSNLLFIDQPVGTGFSFTERDCYARNEEDVGRDLYSAVRQFYQLFPSLRENKFYITGESYGGHYVPALGHAIHEKNREADLRINLSGMMIGNGLMDAKYQSDYGSYLYQLGFIDDTKRDEYHELEKSMIDQINEKDFKAAYRTLKMMDMSNNHSVSVFKFTKNYVDPTKMVEPWVTFVQQRRVRKAIHVGGQQFYNFSKKVYMKLLNDTVQSVKPLVEELLEHYPIVFYNGQLDIICAYPMVVNFLRNLHWSGAEDYLRTSREKWCVDDQLAGFVRSSGNLHEVMVRAAGHMVPQDRPLWALRLVDSVTSSPPEDPLGQLQGCSKHESEENLEELF